MPVLMSGQNIANLDFASQQITSEVSVTATSSATGDTCMTTGAISLENGGTYYVEIFTPYLTKGTTNLDVELWDGATFKQSLSGHMAASATLGQGVVLAARVALGSGPHTLTVKAFVDGGTGKFGAGTGATGQPPPALLRLRAA
jgi:hypothetical protein